MADYWRAQAKYYCEICQCWLQDNAASISFHERGSKHNLMAEKRLKDIRKKGRETQAKQREEKDGIYQMEIAALMSMTKDIQGDPEMAKQYGLKSDDVLSMEKKRKKTSRAGGSKWREAKAPDGSTYFWHSETREVSWVPQQIVDDRKNAKAIVAEEPPKPPEPELKIMPAEGKGRRRRIPIPKEPHSLPNLNPFKDLEGYDDFADNSASTSSTAPTGIGQWTTTMTIVDKPPEPSFKQVKKSKSDYNSMELPAEFVQKQIERDEKQSLMKEPEFKFQEKTIASTASTSDSVGFASFKKRKATGNIKKRSPEDI